MNLPMFLLMSAISSTELTGSSAAAPISPHIAPRSEVVERPSTPEIRCILSNIPQGSLEHLVEVFEKKDEFTKEFQAERTQLVKTAEYCRMSKTFGSGTKIGVVWESAVEVGWARKVLAEEYNVSQPDLETVWSAFRSDCAEPMCDEDHKSRALRAAVNSLGLRDRRSIETLLRYLIAKARLD